MPLFTYFSLVVTMLLWGGTFIAGRLLAESVEPASAAFLRFMIASAAMLVVTWLVEKKLTIPPKRLWLPLILLGMTGVFVYNVFFFSGLQHISAGRASLIIACTPLIITIFAATFLLSIPATREGLFGRLSTISSLDWASLAYLGLCGTALGFSLYYLAIKKIGATRAGIFINLVPLFSILLSWLILGESVRSIVLAGGFLVLTGVTLTNYRKSIKLSS